MGWRQALPLLGLLVAGCLQLQSDEEKRAFAEQKLMARHDELMARMDELYQLRQQLTKVPDTVLAGRRRQALQAADAGMMQWMHQYHRPADTTRHERAMAYLAAQQHRIDSVGVLMQQSIDSARVVLRATGPTH
ncbi:hypothetical protein B0919_08255 [Hymenobacter sp. CRA2]|nr:hypothetical protein B0919_08255 [Hymenobacter sp. CRA2]